MSRPLAAPDDRRRDRLYSLALWVLLLLLFAERVLVFFELGAEYVTRSDDTAYIESGLYFIRTGVISIWWEYPTAMIMPGMPVVIGLVSLISGEGTTLLVALKMLWCVMGVLTAYFTFKTVAVFAPRWCGLLALCCFFIPNMAWMNNVILTETPYALGLSMCAYYTLQMGERVEKRDCAGYIFSFMFALMFRANILTFPLFTAVYLLLRRNMSGKQLLRRGLALCCALLLFFIPWTVRNALRFGQFIPVSYGAGNPLLLGTYQGEGYPEDEELDYSVVHMQMREKYPDYYREIPEFLPGGEERDTFEQKYDPYGDIKEMKYAQFLSLTEDGMKARYRMSEWFKNDPSGFLLSYLFIKPRWMLNWSWAWQQVLSTPYSVLHLLSQINFVFCAVTVVLSLLLKKHRRPVLFLTAVYFANVYIHATAFVSDRYASTLMVLRYIIFGFGVDLIVQLFIRLRHKLMRRSSM